MMDLPLGIVRCIKIMCGLINRPFLFIAGELDEVTTVEEAKRMQSLVEKSKLIILPANHLSNVEKVSDFSSAILNFVY